MKQKLLGFKRLLKEENELSQKISVLTDKSNNSKNSNAKKEVNLDNSNIDENKKDLQLDEITQEI